LSNCCSVESRIPSGGKKIVLAGNPNVGKSVFFNDFTRLYVDVSNYPGTTLDMACGRFGSDVVIDTPGVYGFSSLSEEEAIARDIILEADIVVNIVDAVHLERDLFLTLQLIDMGIPMVVALNMVDEAAREGMKVKSHLLEKLLGVPVVPTVAVSGRGMEELKRKVYFARPGHVEPFIREKLSKIQPPAGSREALLILEGDPVISARSGMRPGTERDALYRARRERVNDIAARVIDDNGGGASFASRLGRLMLLPLTGFPLLLLTLWGIYEIVGVFLAQFVVDNTVELMEGYYEPVVKSLMAVFVSPDSVVGTILAGRFGLLTMTVTYMFGLLLPLVLGIFFVLSILEDSGYLPRIAALIDRVLIGFGLNGQAIIPLILGFGCVTMSLITTRMLGTQRERRIATFLLVLGVPCSAQMAIVTAVLAGIDPAYAFLYLLFIFSMLVFAGTFLGRFLPGWTSPLLIELPQLRLPKPKNVLQKTRFKSWGFIKEAFPIFAGGMLLLSILEVSGLLNGIRNFLMPITVSWLHLPPEMADVFIMGFIRKEFGAAFILNIPMLELQKFVVLVTLTLTVPCIASTMIVFKERGWWEGFLIWFSVYFLAFFTGGVLTRLLEAFNTAESLRPLALSSVVFFFLVAALIIFRLLVPDKKAI
jgi:ferrous iron transport protein B